MTPSFGMPPLAQLRKGTPEAIVAEQLAAYRALREELAAPISHHDQNSNATQTAKEKQMPARPSGPARSTAATRAKAALRASKLARRGEPVRPVGTAAKPPVPSESSFEHHRRKCLVCNHPEREAIEELFINWHSPRAIHSEFGIYPRLDWSSIYRHARAAGLYAKRRKNLRAVFDLVLEQAADVAPTAHGIVAVVRGYSCLTDTHKWVEPEKRVRITNHVYRHDLPAAADVPACPEEGRAASNTSTGLSNRNTTELESPPSHT